MRNCCKVTLEIGPWHSVLYYRKTKSSAKQEHPELQQGVTSWCKQTNKPHLPQSSGKHRNSAVSGNKINTSPGLRSFIYDILFQYYLSHSLWILVSLILTTVGAIISSYPRRLTTTLKNLKYVDQVSLKCEMPTFKSHFRSEVRSLIQML